MKITEDFLNSKSVEELLVLLKPIYDIIYEKYSFLNYSYSKFQESIKEIIIDSKTSFPDERYSLYLSKKGEQVLLDYMSEQLSNPKNGIEVIHRLLEQNKNDSIESQYNKFKDIIQRVNYDLDIIPLLIKEDSIFQNMVESIFKKHRNAIINGKMDFAFNDEFLVLIMESYCMIHNIEIKESEEDLSDSEKNELYSDNYKIYIKEVSGHEKLDSNEEKRLAYLIREGDE